MRVKFEGRSKLAALKPQNCGLGVLADAEGQPLQAWHVDFHKPYPKNEEVAAPATAAPAQPEPEPEPEPEANDNAALIDEQDASGGDTEGDDSSGSEGF